MESKSKKLRSGYTTGACAAAAAKAAALLVLSARCGDLRPALSSASAREQGVRSEGKPERIDIPFPDGNRVTFKVHDSGYRIEDQTAWASVIKDAGDDPDITHGAEIRAEARMSAEWNEANADCRMRNAECNVIINGGNGVGIVTKPGLAVPVGEAAINPVPRKMILDSVKEAIAECGVNREKLIVTVSVPKGEELAKKTLNSRLGIVGGISILGTTGVVRPLSQAAWTATIDSSFDVAKALGRQEVVLSTGRTSEKAHQQKYGFPEDCYAMMGDYTEFSLKSAARHGFERIHLCAQWAKMVKIAMETPETHVRHGAIEADHAASFLRKHGLDIPGSARFNTVREVFDYLSSTIRNPQSAFVTVCNTAREYAERITSGIPVAVHLVSYEGKIIAESA